MLAATFSLTNCAKELSNPQTPEVAGTPFEIVVSAPETKTVNDGMKTVWAANDAINLFHAVTDGKTYVDDGKFSITEANLAAGKFTGTVNGTLDVEEEYDWYAFYPYSSYIKTPANTSSGYMPVGCKSNEVQTQNGNNSMAHIAGANYPVAGRSIAVASGSTPEIVMSHVSSLLEIVVTNTVDTPLTVSDISFTATEDIVGTYFINFAGETVSYKGSGDGYVSKTAVLEVKNGTALAKGESAKFYLAVKPFEAAAGAELTLDVNGCTKKIALASNVNFNAGKIKTLNFDYDLEVAEDTHKATLTFDADKFNRVSYSTTSQVWAQNGVTVTNNKSTSTTNVADYGNPVRLYKGSELVISGPGNIVRIQFKSAANGTSDNDKFLDYLTAVLPNPSVSGSNVTVELDGIASSVTYKLTEGQVRLYEIVVTYSGEEYVAPTLSSIAASGYMTEFVQGDVFAFGGTVTATYSDGSTRDVTGKCNFSGYNPEQLGEQTVTVTYEGITTSYNVTVSEKTETGGGEGVVVLSEQFDNNSTSDSSQAITSTTFSNFSGATSKAYKSKYGGIKLGSSSAVGSITSKSLDLSSSFTVQLDACKYSSDSGNITVTVGSVVKTISNSELSAAGTFKTFTLEFSAATASSTVKIATSSKRAYIDNVVITRY